MYLKLPKKLIKFNEKLKKYELQEINTKTYLENKKVLILYPYPSRDKLNSQLYDNIMETMKLSEKINPEQSNEQMDMSIYNIKKIQDFNEIIAISQLNEKESIHFLTNNKLKRISLLISEHQNVMNEYEKMNRFEMVLNNLQVVELRKDPTIFKLVIRSFGALGSSFFFIVIFLSLLTGYLRIRSEQRFQYNLLLTMIS